MSCGITTNTIIAEQNGGNGSISLRHINNKFKNLVIPAGLALYDTHHIHSHSYDVIHQNEQVHDSLYDRLLELASYNDDKKTTSASASSKKKLSKKHDENDSESDSDGDSYDDNKNKSSHKKEDVKVQPVISQNKIKKYTKKNNKRIQNNENKKNKQTRRNH